MFEGMFFENEQEKYWLCLYMKWFFRKWKEMLLYVLSLKLK